MNERSERVQHFFHLPVIIAALLSLPVIVIEYTEVSDSLKTIAAVANWAIWLVFLAEVVAMLWVVPNRWRWIAQNPLDVLIVVLTPPLLPPGLQWLRVLRLLRLVKLAQLSRHLFSLQGLRLASLLALATLIGGGAAFAAVENEQDLDLWDGVWWAAGTMSTAGSGIQPDTTGGRIIAMATMVVGLSFVALLTGFLAERFLGQEFQDEIEAREAEDVRAEGTIDVEQARVLTQFKAMRAQMDAMEAEIERLMRRD